MVNDFYTISLFIMCITTNEMHKVILEGSCMLGARVCDSLGWLLFCAAMKCELKTRGPRGALMRSWYLHIAP